MLIRLPSGLKNLYYLINGHHLAEVDLGVDCNQIYCAYKVFHCHHKVNLWFSHRCENKWKFI